HNPKSINRGGSLLDEKPGSLLGGNQQSEVRLIPNGSGLMIELVGELAGLLALGQEKTASEAVASGRSVTLVAGVGFGLYRTSDRLS
ncbi:hypothetical protein, partial [Ruegeria sp. PrR005]